MKVGGLHVEGKAQLSVSAHEVGEHEAHRDGVCQERAVGCTPYAHVEGKDEDIVEDDV